MQAIQQFIFIVILFFSSYSFATIRQGFVTTSDQTKLSYYVYGETSANPDRDQPLLIVPGKGESRHRYQNLIVELLKYSFGPIYVYEHRGHGSSTPSFAEDPEVIHIDDFQSYVEDLSQFTEDVALAELNAKKFKRSLRLIAHSMGGAVTNLALLKKPHLSDRVVYIAPMFDLDTGNWLLNSLEDGPAQALMNLLCWAGCERAIIKTDHQNELPVKQAEIKEGIRKRAVTFGWTVAAIEATKLVRDNAAKSHTPTLLIEATEDDIIHSEGLRQYACEAPNCRHIKMKGPHGLHFYSERTVRLLAKRISQYFDVQLSPFHLKCRRTLTRFNYL